jgi:hypothetical protein
MKNSLFNVDPKRWAQCAIIRAIKTFAQTCVGLIPATVTIEEVNWETMISAAILAAFASLLTSLAGIPEVESEDEE